MKLRLKIILAAIIIGALFYLNLYLLILLYGKPVLAKKLSELTRRNVTIGTLNITPPLNLKIKRMQIEGLATIDSLYISPSILGLLGNNITLNRLKLIKPHFTYEKESVKATPETTAPSLQSAPSASTFPTPVSGVPAEMPRAKKEKPVPILIKRFIIRDGRVDFIDSAISEKGIRITVRDIKFNLTNFTSYPRSVISDFELEGKIPWSGSAEEGTLEAKGWFNLFKKDMQATLEIRDIDGISLYPYYSTWVDLEKARIEKAKLNFTSSLQGANNFLTAECHLELADILRRPLEDGESAQKASKITDAVLDIFKNMDQGRIALDFNIKTRMDRPQFSFSNIKMAFEDKLNKGRNGKGRTEEVLMFPSKFFESAIKSATNISRALIESAANLGKGIKKAVEDAFRKEPPAPANP